MNKEQIENLKKEFKLYLEIKYPGHSEETYKTKKSDAFYPFRHPNVGMDFFEVYSSKENLEYYCELFESYWINEKKKSSKSIGAYKKAFQDFFEFFCKEVNSNISSTTRSLILINRINRNIKLADDLKKDYQNKCQFCREKLKIGKNKYYSEAHHIIPVGEPHNGVDIRDNMLVVCPNCHVQLDRGFLKINLCDMFVIDNHNINQNSITYHNNNIYIK